jgi:hypothetical protein
MLLRRLARDSGGEYRIAEDVIAQRAKRNKIRRQDD